MRYLERVVSQGQQCGVLGACSECRLSKLLLLVGGSGGGSRRLEHLTESGEYATLSLPQPPKTGTERGTWGSMQRRERLHIHATNSNTTPSNFHKPSEGRTRRQSLCDTNLIVRLS